MFPVLKKILINQPILRKGHVILSKNAVRRIEMKLKEMLQDYLEYCQYRKELDNKTVKAYRIDLRQYFEFVGECDLDKNWIERYITNLHKNFRQKTVKRKIASVKAFYNFLEDEELIQENPFRKIKVKFKETSELPKIIPREKIEQLLQSMYTDLKIRKKKEKSILRDIAVVETLFATGARVSEISNIKKENINLNTGVIRIMGKGGKERYILIGERSVLELLKRYYEQNYENIKQSGYFFVNRDGERFSEQSIRLMIKRYAKNAGIERNITPHMFRHSFATYLIEEGVDISCVQRILGHSSIKTTQIYIHVASKKQAEILRDMHPRQYMKVGLVA